jgi:hypothetical protein
MRMHVALTVGLLSFAVVSAAAAAPGLVALPPLLVKEIASAKQSGTPVLIPARLNAGLPASRLYGSGGKSGGGYDIQLAAAPGCDDANACFVAEFWGGRGKLELASRLTLSRGIQAAFLASHCGASCAPAAIEWLEFGHRYTIQFTGSRSALAALADSAIAAGPR